MGRCVLETDHTSKGLKLLSYENIYSFEITNMRMQLGCWQIIECIHVKYKLVSQGQT